MKKMLRKVLMLMVGVAFSSVSYASMVETDTIVMSNNANVYIPAIKAEYITTGGATIENLYVDEIKSESGSVSLPDVTTGLVNADRVMSGAAELGSITGNGIIICKKGPMDTSNPSIQLWSSYESRQPSMTIGFLGETAGDGLNVTTMSRGYCVPITFEASEYNFKFTRGLESAPGVMHVDGKIICKDELKVAEVNTDKIRAKDIDVDFNDAADYVFAEDYHLKPLREVEAYVKENKHLPGVPSADEFSNQGMNVSKMSNLLLEKVEELTLHIIQLQKEVEALKAANEALRNGK